MFRGTTIGLRARVEADVTVLHTELYDDVEAQLRADDQPWRPIPAGSSASPFAVHDLNDRVDVFSVVQLSDGGLAGTAVLWGINAHQRSAHIGLGLRPALRGRGLGT